MGSPTKIAVIFTTLVAAATTVVAAETKTVIIEYPDHFYVESTGTPGKIPASSPKNSAPSGEAPPVVPSGNDAVPASKAPASAAPVTNFDDPMPTPTPAERRASMMREIERLQSERSNLLTPEDGETPDDLARRQGRAAAMLRKINKMSSVLLSLPASVNAPDDLR